MKKQIFILVLVFFAVGLSNVFGQATTGSLPQPLFCTPDAYHPIPGVSYDYSAIVNPIGGNAYWFATDKTSFITASGLMATTDMFPNSGTVVKTGLNYMNGSGSAAATTTTKITWTTAGLAAATVVTTADPKLFVAMHYTGAGCNDNLKVYPIRPINAFTIDIKNMDQSEAPVATYATNVQTCFADILSATYSSGGGTGDGKMIYDFGTNNLYFEIVASNFAGAYIPTLRLAGLDAKQKADIKWGYVKGTYDQNLTINSTNGDYPISGGITADATVANISLGVSIYVQVTVHNNNFEGTLLKTLTLAVEAVNEANQHDVINTTCAVPAVAAQFEDIASQDLKPRPTTNSVAPNTFLPIQ